MTNTAKNIPLKLSRVWDKTFPKSDRVRHSKVSFPNRYGITLAADLYIPKKSVFTEKNHGEKIPAVVVSGPFGAVKEQCSGLYAQHMAEEGYVSLAFDPSFTGESSGTPRYMASPDINTEDFQAAVDFLSNYYLVDPERIGIIGICGWGGLAINTAALDTRVKATVAVTMYDMTRVNANGYFDGENSEEARHAKKEALNKVRTEEFATGLYSRAGGCIAPESLPSDAPFFVRDYTDYYKTDRGYHRRSLNSNEGWNTIGCISFMNQPIMKYSGEIRSAVLLVHGEKAHSRYFSEDAYRDIVASGRFTENKELYIVPGAVHTDLYDGGRGGNFIPWNKILDFFGKNL